MQEIVNPQTQELHSVLLTPWEEGILLMLVEKELWIEDLVKGFQAVHGHDVEYGHVRAHFAQILNRFEERGWVTSERKRRNPKRRGASARLSKLTPEGEEVLDLVEQRRMELIAYHDRHTAAENASPVELVK